ncbi:hypothetical protein COF84_25715 [Bacillus wiedmannii]|uniref:HEPN domain-containing protein n=1 Tax=Bacillus wiedmannii TaxID=1890302 RepID=UPI000BFE527F|nr:HEPN domain-containing protein [Bacillus wiedmannii]PHF12378.1 hypothetical protein COF84_25715 [Bacillus wiedmannii]
MQLKIPFLLSSELPVSENDKIFFDDNIVSFDTYVQKITHQKIDLLNLPEKTNTIIWLTKYLDHIEDVDSIENKNEVLKDFVFQGLQCVNFFLDAFRDVSNLDYMKNIDFLDLPNPIPVLINSEAEYIQVSEISAHEHYVYKEPSPKVINVMNFWISNPEYRLINQFHSQAKASMQQGNFPIAIIQLQTAFEIIVKTSLKKIIINNGLMNDEKLSITNKKIQGVERLPLKKLIEEELSRYLNENLNFKDNKEIKNWVDNLYIYRNQIVHTGKHDITKAQVDSAYDSFLKVEKYLTALLFREQFDPELLKVLTKAGVLPKDISAN